MDEVRSSLTHTANVYDARNEATEERLNKFGNSINAIKAGRLLGVVAAGGGGNSVQQQALTSAAIQTQDCVQYEIRGVKEDMQWVRNHFSDERDREKAIRAARRLEHQHAEPVEHLGEQYQQDDA